MTTPKGKPAPDAKAPSSWRREIVANLLWFLGAFIFAVVVWMTAINQGDPVEQWRIPEAVPIRIQPDSGLLMVDLSSQRLTANVQVRSQQSERALLAPEDITVSADLEGMGPGTYTVPLQAQVAPERRAIITAITPSQITVTLELQETRLVPVSALITQPPPLVVNASEPTFDLRQVTVTGPASRVQRVTEVRASFNLADSRESFEEDVRLTPVDVDGRLVDGVTIEPQTAHATITIEPNSDVREVRVQPNPVGALGDGYVLTSFDYSPEVIYVSGPVDILQSLPGTLFTTPINLSGRSGSFSEEVTVQLPSPELVIITGQTITVNVGITTQIITRQFDLIPVEVINPFPGATYTLDPERLSVLVTGPEPQLKEVNDSDLRVFVDVANLTSGTYTLTPNADIAQIGGLPDTAIALLPAQVNVEITMPTAEPTPEVTAPAPGN